MDPERLVIFDYSGTLSLSSVLFGTPGNLMGQLKESGLYDLGVENLDFFWHEIVAPTWEKGSTTGAGYAALIAGRLINLFPEKKSAEQKVIGAAARFVQSYLDHSMPDPGWIPLLSRLTAQRGTAVVIATDHYAEATAAILRFLERENLTAVSAPKAFQNSGTSNRIIVANSADLGFPKGDRRFWEILKGRLSLATARRILYVDDFGFNEERSDPYSALEKVDARRRKTSTVLEEVFPGEVRVLPFLLRPGAETSAPPPGPEALHEELIARTAGQVEDWMAEG